MRRVTAFQIVDEKTVGEGGFLTLRRLRLRLELDDGAITKEGLYDFVERPVGLDAVVLVLWHRASDGRVQVLLRDGLRIPLLFGRGRPSSPPPLFTELVAGILEAGEDDEAGLRARAAAEAFEEAGLVVQPESVIRLGAPLFPSPGMCAERLHLVAVEVPAAALAESKPPEGDGSPFEEGAHVRFVPLDEALAACGRGEISDMKTELGLRRLAERLA